ncbi:hypothetical protein [Pontibacter litorisediminis]|uniref:hypothetical protein n=1 Tax=Pontibacter litorisediminis TaxID=1846260 RepID=UPI0023EC8E92|nr:hypothetical protein [Pontibacter litorisediminis]
MILHHNSLIKLEYSPATDILQVNYPDLYSYQLSEVRHSLAVMVEAIRNYDVKRLLLDASVTAISIGEAENRELSISLAASLAKTRLQKVARIHPLNPTRESIAQENISNILRAGPLPYQLRTFSNRTQALQWLVEK